MTARDVKPNFFDDGISVAGSAELQVMDLDGVDLAISGGNVALDLNRSSLFRLTLTADVTVPNPTEGLVAGRLFHIQATQDGTGGWEITWGSNFKWGQASAPTLGDDAAALVTIIHGLVVSPTYIALWI